MRRRIIIGTLLFCAGEIMWLTFSAPDTRLAETIANGLIILAGSVIGAYVFGAVWDDRNVMAMSRRPPDDDDDPAPPPKDFAG